MEKQATFAGKIKTSRVAYLNKRIARVNKHAAKVGHDGLTVEYGETTTEVVGNVENGLGQIIEVRCAFIEVTVTGDAPMLPGGWQLVAAIDQRGEIPLISAVPGIGIEVPVKYRESKPTCDHCRKTRIRKDNFLIIDESGTYKLVGRNCLADFLGALGENPEHIIRLATYFGELSNEISEHEDEDLSGQWHGGGEYVVSIEDVTLAAMATIDNDGWAPSAFESSSTRSRTSFILNPPKAQYRTAADQEWLDEINERMQGKGRDLKAESLEAIAWAKSLLGGHDFEHKLAGIAVNGFVTYKHFGMAVCIGMSYRKHQDRLKKYEADSTQRAKSEHVGTVGKRESFTVTLDDVKAFENEYGVSYLHRFTDDNDNIMIWWSSGKDLNMESGWTLGERGTIKATVKGHDDYKGTEQTKVNRVAIIAINAAFEKLNGKAS